MSKFSVTCRGPAEPCGVARGGGGGETQTGGRALISAAGYIGYTQQGAPLQPIIESKNRKKKKKEKNIALDNDGAARRN